MRRVASHIFMRGYNAAILPADADLHALPNHYSDAMHEMWHPDEIGPDRTASAESGFADLPVRPLRLRRELFEADIDRAGSRYCRVIRVGDRPRWYSGPLPLDPDARRKAKPLRSAQGLSSDPLHPATSSCVGCQAPRADGTTTPSLDSLLGHSWGISRGRVAPSYARRRGSRIKST